MEKIRLGDYNLMQVVKEVDFGMYLDGGVEGEILLPTRYVPKGLKVGDAILVFVYLDQDERPVATTLQPLAKVGDFAYLEVAWVNEYGAFLNWGLMKDLFCPFLDRFLVVSFDLKVKLYIFFHGQPREVGRLLEYKADLMLLWIRFFPIDQYASAGWLY